MHKFIYLFLILALTACSTHSVKLGKKCTKVASDDTYEKSFVWIVNKINVDTFD